MDFFMPELVLEENDLHLPQELTDIQKFYADCTILVTGGTGFLGKLLLEKLLRACPDVAKIYILMRVKNHYNAERRLIELLEVPIFDYLMRTRPEVFRKLHLVRGDLGMRNLGLTSEDASTLVAEVDIVFNCAATPLFDNNLKYSTAVNVAALKDLIGMSKHMKNLKAFVHLSSVYANCPKNVLEEEFSKPYVSAKALIEFVNSLDPHYRHWKPIALGKWPNNHLFTKSIAEDVIRTEGGPLPITIVRPSIVMPTSKQPICGWTDNVSGPTGLVMTSYLGLTRSILAKATNVADIVPADHVVNVMLVAGWDVAKSKSLNENEEIARSEEGIPIYNLPSWKTNTITWGKFFKLSAKYGKKLPSVHAVWHPWNIIHQNKSLHFYLVLFLHYLPAYFYDCVIFYLSTDSKYLGYYSKIDSLSDTLSFYTLNTWDIKSSNTRDLWRRMSSVDRHIFDFDAESIDWELYFYTYIRGVRTHVLKDSLETVEDALRMYKKRLVTMITVAIGVASAVIVYMAY